MMKGLRWKIVVANMLVAALMLCVIFALVYHFTRESLERESLETLQTLADDPYPLGVPGRERTEVNLPYFILQIGLNGDVVAASGGFFDLSDEDFVRAVLSAVLAGEQSMGELPEYRLRYLREPGLLSQSIVFVDTSGEKQTLDNLLSLSVLLGLAALLAFLPLSLLFARWAAGPVEKAWSQQKQFVADASHELKTPLTVILTNAELLADPAADGERKQGYARNILTVSRQMRALVEALLELARTDRGRETAALRELDLSALAARTLLPFEAVFFEKELTLYSEIRPGLCLRGDGEQLRRLLEILLDNAGKYAQTPGWVKLTLKRQGKQALLTVENPGEPLTEAQCRDIFRRFVRLDGARRRDGGYGLGLSIGENIVRAHGGRIWAESGDGIVRFCVSLPGLCGPGAG